MVRQCKLVWLSAKETDISGCGSGKTLRFLHCTALYFYLTQCCIRTRRWNERRAASGATAGRRGRRWTSSPSACRATKTSTTSLHDTRLASDGTAHVRRRIHFRRQALSAHRRGRRTRANEDHTARRVSASNDWNKARRQAQNHSVQSDGSDAMWLVAAGGWIFWHLSSFNLYLTRL